MIEQQYQNNLGKKDYWFKLPYHCSPLSKVKTGTQPGKEPGSWGFCRRFRKVPLPGWLTLVCSVILIATNNSSLCIASYKMGQTFSHQSLK